MKISKDYERTLLPAEFFTKERELEALNTYRNGGKVTVGIERLALEQDKQKRIQDAVAVLINEISMGDGKSLGIEIAGILKSTHPTLQQGFIQALKTVIEEHADTAYTDPRNQASVEWCKAVVAESSRGTFPYI